MGYLYVIATGIAHALQYSLLPNITNDTGISTATLVEGNGLMLLFFGWSCLLWQPLALVYGRRGVYLASTLLTVPIMVWTGFCQTGAEWYAHRILIGVVVAPIESLPEVTVFDIFFAHNRGTYMGLYVFVLFGSTFVAPLIAGPLNDTVGWRWTMWIGAIICAVCFVIMFFFMEETMYFRDTTETPAQRREPLDSFKIEASTKVDAEISDEHLEIAGGPRTCDQSSILLSWNRLKPFRSLPGRPSNKTMLQMVYRPIIMAFQFPTTAWSGFFYGINLAWYAVQNGTLSPVLSAPPYNFSLTLIGCMYIGPLIGAGISSLWAGPFADWTALYLARRNNGIREPEHRLWPLIGSGIVGAAGLVAWGAGAHNNTHWVGLAFGLTMLTFGAVSGGSISVAYNVDCFKEIGGETTVSVMLIRNTFGFRFSYAITPWVTAQGLQNCFITAAVMSIVCMSTFLGIVYWGKYLRRKSADIGWRYTASSGMQSH